MSTEDVMILIALAAILGKVLQRVAFGSGWWWPVPDRVENGLRTPAAISQEFRGSSSSAPHLGVDVMYRTGGRWVADVGTPILAARGGRVWSTGLTARGHNVVIDHGAPWATFYQHLASVSVAQGDLVVAGQQIGEMGADPTDPQGVVHLHFATWYKGSGDQASIDPGSAMATWKRSTWNV